MSPLTIEFLTWISSRPRTYSETMEAWRNSCPRHPVWDDALNDGLIQIVNTGGSAGDGDAAGGPAKQVTVILTPRGRALLDGS